MTAISNQAITAVARGATTNTVGRRSPAISKAAANSAAVASQSPAKWMSTPNAAIARQCAVNVTQRARMESFRVSEAAAEGADGAGDWEGCGLGDAAKATDNANSTKP